MSDLSDVNLGLACLLRYHREFVKKLVNLFFIDLNAQTLIMTQIHFVQCAEPTTCAESWVKLSRNVFKNNANCLQCTHFLYSDHTDAV